MIQGPGETRALVYNAAEVGIEGQRDGGKEEKERKTASAYRTRTALVSVRVERERWISREIKETERDMKINNAAQGGLHDTI